MGSTAKIGIFILITNTWPGWTYSYISTNHLYQKSYLNYGALLLNDKMMITKKLLVTNQFLYTGKKKEITQQFLSVQTFSNKLTKNNQKSKSLNFHFRSVALEQSHILRNFEGKIWRIAIIV